MTSSSLSRRRLLAGSVALASTTAVPTAGHAGAAWPDAELLRLGALYAEAYALANSRGLTDEEHEEHCEVLADVEFKIHAIPAQTLAGLAVKARVARDVVLPVDPDQPTLDDIMTSLIEDVLRISGSGAAS